MLFPAGSLVLVAVLAGAPGQPTRQHEGLRVIDVGPTILDLFGVDALEGAEGKSFL